MDEEGVGGCAVGVWVWRGGWDGGLSEIWTDGKSLITAGRVQILAVDHVLLPLHHLAWEQ